MASPKEILRATNGRFFSVEFLKKDASTRRLNGRVGVKRYVKGTGMAYDPEERGLLVVYDLQKRGYRMVNLETVKRIKCWGKEYVFDQEEHGSKVD